MMQESIVARNSGCKRLLHLPSARLTLLCTLRRYTWAGAAYLIMF